MIRILFEGCEYNKRGFGISIVYFQGMEGGVLR